jgi:hypothetical protein
MQDGTGLHDTGRSGRPARISDAEIRVEIERRLSGPPEDLGVTAKQARDLVFWVR